MEKSSSGGSIEDIGVCAAKINFNIYIINVNILTFFCGNYVVFLLNIGEIKPVLYI